MRTTVIIQNITCNDCRPKILAAFDTFKGISNIEFNINIGSLSFDYTTHNVLEGLRMYLTEIGHAITTDPNIITESN